MFNTSFNARVEGFSARVRQQKGNNQDQRYVRLNLLYEFDEPMAAEIGGPAPGVLAAMMADYDAGRVGAVPLTLNSRAVNVRFRVGRKNHVIRDTVGLDTRAIPPTAKNLSAMLAVRVSFLASADDIGTLWQLMGQQVPVQMDREQLMLPGMGGGPAPELDPETSAALDAFNETGEAATA